MSGLRTFATKKRKLAGRRLYIDPDKRRLKAAVHQFEDTIYIELSVGGGVDWENQPGLSFQPYEMVEFGKWLIQAGTEAKTRRSLHNIP